MVGYCMAGKFWWLAKLTMRPQILFHQHSIIYEMDIQSWEVTDV